MVDFSSKVTCATTEVGDSYTKITHSYAKVACSPFKLNHSSVMMTNICKTRAC